ncbi:hypothetical protein CTI14_18260 [Methylobacterium radiotolerans]|nr:hypothetical protein CTI14_18260 [Methylobacterium radiotolerans]
MARATCPWDESRSWVGGEWAEFYPKTYSAHELLALTEDFPRLFADELDELAKGDRQDPIAEGR